MRPEPIYTDDFTIEVFRAVRKHTPVAKMSDIVMTLSNAGCCESFPAINQALDRLERDGLVVYGHTLERCSGKSHVLSSDRFWSVTKSGAEATIRDARPEEYRPSLRLLAQR